MPVGVISMTRVAPGDHNVFLALGVYLRRREELEAAEKALTRAAELMGQMQPDFRVIRELGFTYLAMDPNRQRDLIQRISEGVQQLVTAGHQPMVLCSAQVRLHVRRLIERSMPTAAVLSYNEIDPAIRLQSTGMISGG